MSFLAMYLQGFGVLIFENSSIIVSTVIMVSMEYKGLTFSKMITWVLGLLPA